MFRYAIGLGRADLIPTEDEESVYLSRRSGAGVMFRDRGLYEPEEAVYCDRPGSQ